jgi:hypothetical protein
MCDHCAPIDQKITRYHFMARWVNDPVTLKGIADLTAEYEAKKRALHPAEN